MVRDPAGRNVHSSYMGRVGMSVFTRPTAAVGFQRVAAPPAGGRIGVNMRLTESGIVDGPENVWVLAEGDPSPGAYPIDYTNDNSVSLTAGLVAPGATVLYKWAEQDTWDTRLRGNMRNAGSNYDYRVDLANGNWRIRMAWAVWVGANVNCVVYDGPNGGTNLFQVVQTTIPAGEVCTQNDEFTTRAVWAAEYETKFQDVVVTQGYITMRHAFNNYWSHFSVEPTP